MLRPARHVLSASLPSVGPLGLSLSLSLALAATLAATGCGDDDTGSGGSGGGTASSTGTTTGATTSGGATTGAGGDATGSGGAGGEGGVFMPDPDELEVGVWTELRPGGDTVCARGTEYVFFARPGTTNKVVVDFIGGGACWNEQTCGLGDAIFDDSVENIRGWIADDVFDGIYNHDNPDNPVGDYWHVVIPYCTGDIHWGNATVTYGEGTEDEVTIEHKGSVNARTVLDWVYEGFPAPEQVFVTGCSAGSYGSAMWAPHIMQHYDGVDVVQFGDSGAGIITPEFFQESFPSWNAEQAFPAFIPALDPALVDVLAMQLPDLYVGIADFFPTNRLSQYNTYADENQFFYFAAMGGGAIDGWTEQMLASTAEIESRTTGTFASYLAQGEQHCIIPYENFYDAQVGDTRLTDWLAAMLEGPVASVACEGAECEEPTPGATP